MSRPAAVPATETYVARWRSDEGHFTVLATREQRCLRLVVQGHPMELRKLPLEEERFLQRLDYSVKKAARSMRRFAKNNASDRVRHHLDAVLGACA